MYQHNGKRYPTLHDMVGEMRKKFGATKEKQAVDEPSADYPLGGLVEPYDIARDNELTDAK